MESSGIIKRESLETLMQGKGINFTSFGVKLLKAKKGD